MDIFVRNLPLNLTSSQLEQLFSMYGKVLSARVVLDRETNESRGFAFVTMPVEAEAKLAIRRISGSEIDGRIISAQKARPRGAHNNNNSSSFKTANDTVLPRSFKSPQKLVNKDYH